MTDYDRFCSNGMQNFQVGKYNKAARFYKKAHEILEIKYGKDSAKCMALLFPLSDSYTRANRYEEARFEATKLLNLATRHNSEYHKLLATAILDECKEEIGDDLKDKENVQKGSEAEPNQDANVKDCLKQKENISVNCQKVKMSSKVFKEHSENIDPCKENAKNSKCVEKETPLSEKKVFQKKLEEDLDLNKLSIQNEPVKDVKSENAKSDGSNIAKCGLCGHTGDKSIKLMKTECCSRWVCDDEHTYPLNSYLLNSCARNHSRYSMCSVHFENGHKGKLRNCNPCNQQIRNIYAHSMHCRGAEWQKFSNKYFDFENIDEDEMKRNRLFKTDGSEAMQFEIPLNDIKENCNIS